jgi:type I restriction enzyme S subunit
MEMAADALQDGWYRKPIGEVAPIDATPILPTETPQKKFFYIALENVESGTGRLVGSTVTKGENIKSNKIQFGVDHVLLGKLRPYLNKVVVPEQTGICSTDILPLKPDSKLLTREFLAWCLRSPEFIGYSSSKMEGGKMPRLRTPDLESYEIPVPPLAEQERIVARVESLTSRSQKLRELNASLFEDMTRLLRAEYKRITEDAPTKPFSDVAKLVRRWVKTKPDQNYPETGIRSFGKGTFHKPALTGEQLGTKRICRINAGDLVFMNVFAWEGAIAVAQPEDDGRVASHRFMMHEVLPDQATAEFLCYYFLTERGLEQIRGASPGSAGRNRTLGITKLEKIPVPVPPIEDQRRFAKLRKLHFQLQRLHREAEAELASFTPALLAKAFRGEL